MIKIIIVIGLILFVIWFGKRCNKKIKNKRIKYACKFGKLEHKSGSLLGLFLLITIFLAFIRSELIIYSVVITFIIWVVYKCSHKVEKKLYPSNFRG